MNTGPTRVIHSSRLVSGGRTTPDAWVVFTGDTVSDVGSGTGWQTLGAKIEDVTDAAGRLLTPGFIDIHCHGGGGFAFDDGTDRASRADAIRTALAVHHRHGTTRIVLSLVTASQADLESRLAAVDDAAEENPLVLGATLRAPSSMKPSAGRTIRRCCAPLTRSRSTGSSPPGGAIFAR